MYWVQNIGRQPFTVALKELQTVVEWVTLEVTRELSQKGASILDLDLRYSNAEWGGPVKDCNQLKLTSLSDTRGHINRIRQRHIYDNMVLGSPCKLPFKDGCFTLVFAMNAVSLLDEEGALAVMFECIRAASEKYYVRSPYPSLAVLVGFVKARKHEMISIS
jgi:hypothetical protein